ncbi:MAG: hypothetical protein NZ876_00540 [Dehalococcoidia bacterium]|nr:hypothetical protein [Dehalococcoidia bacterium]
MGLVNVLELGEQGFQRTISSGGTLEHGIAYTEVISMLASVKQSMAARAVLFVFQCIIVSPHSVFAVSSCDS